MKKIKKIESETVMLELEASEKEKILYKLGARENDIAALLDYTANVFLPCADMADEDFLLRWKPMFEAAVYNGAAAAINKHLVKDELHIDFTEPKTLGIELYNSVGGVIPVITTESVADFEYMVKNIVYKGKDVPSIMEMGASFAFGKSNRFIILSNKPYSNVPANFMGLDEAVWREKSMTIRKHHECAHYYTKRFYGSSRNNLHDELIADFCGIYAAFGEYRAGWFVEFFDKRFDIYTKDLSQSAADAVRRLARMAAGGVEAWTKTESFMRLDEAGRIKYLAEKELLSYIV